jgi:hypothetical protein
MNCNILQDGVSLVHSNVGHRSSHTETLMSWQRSLKGQSDLMRWDEKSKRTFSDLRLKRQHVAFVDLYQTTTSGPLVTVTGSNPWPCPSRLVSYQINKLSPNFGMFVKFRFIWTNNLSNMEREQMHTYYVCTSCRSHSRYWIWSLSILSPEPIFWCHSM